MRAFILVTIAVLTIPVTLAAQNIGFAVGIRNPNTPFPQGGGIGFGAGIAPGFDQGVVYPGYGSGYGYGYAYPGATVIVSPDPSSVPRGGFLPRAPRSAGSIFTVVAPNGAVSVIGPNLTPGQRVAPRHPTATPRHPVAAPLVIPSPVTGFTAPALHQPRGVRVIRGGTSNVRRDSSARGPAAGGVVGTRPVGPISPSEGRAGIGIGSAREDVLRSYGTPTRSIADHIAETLIFGPTRIVIQNGVVVAIGHY